MSVLKQWNLCSGLHSSRGGHTNNDGRVAATILTTHHLHHSRHGRRSRDMSCRPAPEKHLAGALPAGYRQHGLVQVVKTWRGSIADTRAEDLLARHGTRTLLFAGACLCGKLARVSYAHDLHLQLEAAALAAKLLAAVLPTSLSHPQRAVDTAAYTPAALAEGCNLFHDAHALNMPDLLEGAETVARVLTRAGHALTALPVFSIWEWASCRVARSLQQTVRCRVARVHALCSLGLLREACAVVCGLMQGRGLPDPDTDRDAVFPAALAAAVCPDLRSALHPGAAENRAAVNYLMCGEVPEAVAGAYGPWLCAHVALARVKVLSSLAAVPYCWDGLDPAAESWQRADEPPPAKVLKTAI